LPAQRIWGFNAPAPTIGAILEEVGMRAKLLVCAGFLAALAVDGASAKTLRYNITADPAMIDPITYSELISGDILKNVYEGFSDVDKDGKVVPTLATRWQASPDNLTWTFRLRPGVKFHSGKPFTARDVKYSLEQLLVPANKGGLAVQYVTKIVGAKDLREGKATELLGIKVIDDLTVEVRFSEPDVLFPIYPFMFFDSETVKEKGIDHLRQTSAGTGPFAIKEWKRGVEVSTVANKAYWKGAPKIDGVTFAIVPNDETAINQFQAGDLDLVMLQNDTARRVMRDASLKEMTITSPAAQINYLGLNQTRYEPFKDKRVREAFCIAVDRDSMIKGIFGGLGEPLYGQITKGVAGYNPDVKKVPFDPARAKKLLAEAGYPDGKGMPPLAIATIPPSRTESTYLADQMRQVLGVNVEVSVMERGTFLRSLNAGEIGYFHWGWTAGYPDAMYYLSQVWHSKSPYNRARYKSETFDGLIDKAAVTADDQARYKLYHQAEQALLDDWGTCGTYVRIQVALKKPNVEGVVLSPFRFLPFEGVTIK
jgi:oligopeptide transport system substrate-binding protein